MRSRAPSPPPSSNDSSGSKPTPDGAVPTLPEDAPESPGRRAFLRGAGQLVVVGAVVEAFSLAACGYRKGVDCGTCTRTCTDDCTGCTGCTEGCTGCTSKCTGCTTSCTGCTQGCTGCTLCTMCTKCTNYCTALCTIGCTQFTGR